MALTLQSLHLMTVGVVTASGMAVVRARGRREERERRGKRACWYAEEPGDCAAGVGGCRRERKRGPVWI